MYVKFVFGILLGSLLLLTGCSEQKMKSEVTASSITMENDDMKQYDFSAFSNVEITGIDIKKLGETELSVLYQAARYCQAMTDADTETMREIVSRDMIFTHMSGRQQSREEYFADIENGSLCYFTIGMENPEISVDGEKATVFYTSVLNANAYGARGTFRMSGTHYFMNVDGEWIAVNKF